MERATRAEEKAERQGIDLRSGPGWFSDRGPRHSHVILTGSSVPEKERYINTAGTADRFDLISTGHPPTLNGFVPFAQ